MPRGFRQNKDPWHRQLRESDAGAAQGEQDALRHEDPRQTESKIA